MWIFFFFPVNYLSSSSRFFLFFSYTVYSYILDMLFLILLSFSFGGQLNMEIQFPPFAFLNLLYFYI